MSEGLEGVVWLLVPLIATSIAWFIRHRVTKANPNANIVATVGELDRFRKSLSASPTSQRRK
jgi:hypothetical protein